MSTAEVTAAPTPSQWRGSSLSREKAIASNTVGTG
jgi:hypothetical protein